MQGSYRDPETRAYMRLLWHSDIVPNLMHEEIRPLRQILRRTTGLVAVDVGANKGFWSKALLSEFPADVHHVFMIDASPENHRELCEPAENSMMFTADDLTVLSAYHFAAGDAPGEAVLHTNDEGSPLASLYAHDLAGYSADSMRALELVESVTVPVATLDSFIEAHGIERVDVLKLDVEGHELPALIGASGALERGIVDVVAFEFGMHQVESRHFFKDFYQLFDGFGFDMFQAVDGELLPVPRYEYRYENFSDNFIYMGRRR